jgi:hypothetical protein
MIADKAEAEKTRSTESSCCQLIDWFSEGESKHVQIGDARVEVRLVGLKGRRARIAIIAPSGALFSADPFVRKQKPRE